MGTYITIIFNDEQSYSYVSISYSFEVAKIIEIKTGTLPDGREFIAV